MNYKMILPNIFTKKYHRSIMNSIEVSLNHMMHHKITRNYSQLNIEKLQFACSK